MKKILLAVVTLSCVFSYAQNSDSQSKILDILGQERFDNIQNSNPARIVYLEARLEEGYKIINNEGGKFDQVEKLDMIPFRIDVGDSKDTLGTCKDGTGKSYDSAQEFLQKENSGTLNILKYKLKYDREKVVYYQLGSTGKVLMIFPVNHINKVVAQK